jgi:hypothetical protein
MRRIVRAVAYLDLGRKSFAKFDLTWDEECDKYCWEWDEGSVKPNPPPTWEDERFTDFEDAVSDAKSRQWDVYEASYKRI